MWLSRGAGLGNQLGWGVTPSETYTMGHIHTCTILQLYIADTSYFIIQLPYTNSSLSWLFILNLLPLPPSLCVDKHQRAPGARMYIAIHIRRQSFERRQFPTEVKRETRKEKQLQSNLVHIYFFSLLIFTLFFFLCSLYIFQRKMWIPWSGQRLFLAMNENSFSPPF